MLPEHTHNTKDSCTVEVHTRLFNTSLCFLGGMTPPACAPAALIQCLGESDAVIVPEPCCPVEIQCEPHVAFSGSHIKKLKN